MSRTTKPEGLPVCPMNLDAWYRNAFLAQELREALNKPAFQLAVATLKESNLPEFSSLRMGDDSMLARRQAWLAGYADAFRDLQRMATPHQPNPQSEGPQEGREWEHIQPEPDTE